jgi:hypothetical protein
MKKIVGQVVAYVSEDTAREDRRCNVPVPVEDCVCKLPKWRSQCEEQRWWHDESEPVHRKIVMNAMKKKVECESNAVVRKEPDCHMSVSNRLARKLVLTCQDEIRICAECIPSKSIEKDPKANKQSLEIYLDSQCLQRLCHMPRVAARR